MPQDYETREITLFHNELQKVDRLPLADRKANAAEFLDALRRSPDVVGERIAWVLNGSYGQGAYLQARDIVQNRPRMNREAWLVQVVGALEWSVPARAVAAAWKKLTPAEKKRLDDHIQRAIRDALSE